MNAYLVNAGENDVLQEYVAGHPRYEPSYLVDVVFATSRSEAKYTFLSKHSNHDVEWTSIKHVHLLARDVNRDRCVAKSSDEYWNIENWSERARQRALPAAPDRS